MVLHMEWAPWVTGKRCPTCQKSYDIEETWCEPCNSPVIIEYEDVSLPDVEMWEGKLRNEVRRLLPFAELPANNRAVGNTPLCESDWLASELGIESALIKDEGRNPTGHIADRDMALLGASLNSTTEHTLALASTGRSGIAAAAAAAAVGQASQVFVPARAPFGSKAMINVHDGSMNVVAGRFPAASRAYRESRENSDWVVADPIESAICHEGRKMVYFEILADLGGRSPDVLVVPIGMGASIRAIATAAQEARAAGLSDGLPRIILTQPEGCAPFVEPINSKSDLTEWSNPDTIVGELEIPAPRAGPSTVEVLKPFDTEAIAVPDGATLEAAVTTAQKDGLQVSAAGGVGLAGATAASNIDADETVVALNPGAGLLDADVLRSHLMGQGI